jgi:hypothetical protein
VIEPGLKGDYIADPFYLFTAHPKGVTPPVKQRQKGKTKRNICKNTTKRFAKDLGRDCTTT